LSTGELRPDAFEFRPKMGFNLALAGGGGEEAYSELSPDAPEFRPSRIGGGPDPSASVFRPASFNAPIPPVLGVIKVTCTAVDVDINYLEDEVRDRVNDILISRFVTRDLLALSSQTLVVNRGEKGYAKVNFPSISAGEVAASLLNNCELFPGVFISAKLSNKNAPFIDGVGIPTEIPIQSIDLRPDAPEYIPIFAPQVVETSSIGTGVVELRPDAAPFKPRMALQIIPPSSLPSSASSSYSNSSNSSSPYYGGQAQISPPLSLISTGEQLRATAVEFKPKSPTVFTPGGSSVIKANAPAFIPGTSRGSSLDPPLELPSFGGVDGSAAYLRPNAVEFKPKLSRQYT
jgi:hypothetical protein